MEKEKKLELVAEAVVDLMGAITALRKVPFADRSEELDEVLDSIVSNANKLLILRIYSGNQRPKR